MNGLADQFVFLLKSYNFGREYMTEQRFFSGIADLPWDVITINVGFLKEHVETSFILGQRMSCDSKKQEDKKLVDK